MNPTDHKKYLYANMNYEDFKHRGPDDIVILKAITELFDTKKKEANAQGKLNVVKQCIEKDIPFEVDSYSFVMVTNKQLLTTQRSKLQDGLLMYEKQANEQRTKLFELVDLPTFNLAIDYILRMVENIESNIKARVERLILQEQKDHTTYTNIANQWKLFLKTVTTTKPLMLKPNLVTVAQEGSIGTRKRSSSIDALLDDIAKDEDMGFPESDNRQQLQLQQQQQQKQPEPILSQKQQPKQILSIKKQQQQTLQLTSSLTLQPTSSIKLQPTSSMKLQPILSPKQSTSSLNAKKNSNIPCLLDLNLQQFSPSFDPKPLRPLLELDFNRLQKKREPTPLDIDVDVHKTKKKKQKENSSEAEKENYNENEN